MKRILSRGEKLIKLRGDKTQKEVLAEIEKMGKSIDKNTLCNAEKNRNISNTTLEILASYYNVSLDYLKLEEINNSTNTNININKELGLSDKSIEKIKSIIEDENRKSCWLDKGIFNYFVEEFDDLDDFLACVSIVKKCEKDMTILKQFELLRKFKENLYIKEERDKILKRYLELLEEFINGQRFYYGRIEELEKFVDLFNDLLEELEKTKRDKEKINKIADKISSMAFDNSNHLYSISCTNTLRINSCLDRFLNKVKGEKVIIHKKREEKVDSVFETYLKSKNKK